MRRALDGGTDLARLLLRGWIGVTMLAHGVRHARSLPGTASWFESLGFREPGLQARTTAGIELATGTALLAGAGTPLAASAVVGTMGVAAGSVHAQNGFFITDTGYEYVATLAVAATALAALGPGRRSLDHALGLDDRTAGKVAGLAALGLGVAGALGHLKMFWTKPEEPAS